MTFATLLVAAVTSSVIAFWLALPYLPPFLHFSVPSWIAGALLAAFFLPKLRMAAPKGPADRIASRLAHELRAGGYRVTERPGRIDIRSDRLAALKVWVDSTPGGTRVRYQADATPTGWGLIMFFAVFFGFGLGVVSVALVLYTFSRAWGLASRVSALLSKVDVSADVYEDPRSVLVDVLSEARRLAVEAYEAERTHHQDSQGVVFLATLLAWVFLLVWIVVGVPADHPLRQGFAPFAVASGLAAPMAIVASGHVWRRFRPRIRESHRWAERLGEALRLETSPAPAEATAPSTFEVLMEASAEAPRWLEAVRRAGLSRDPAAGYFLFGLTIWTIVSAGAAVTGWAYGPAVSVIFGIAAVGMSVLLVLFYRRWKRRWNAAAQASKAEWARRLADVRARMERFLEGL